MPTNAIEIKNTVPINSTPTVINLGYYMLEHSGPESNKGVDVLG